DVDAWLDLGEHVQDAAALSPERGRHRQPRMKRFHRPAQDGLRRLPLKHLVGSHDLLVAETCSGHLVSLCPPAAIGTIFISIIIFSSTRGVAMRRFFAVMCVCVAHSDGETACSASVQSNNAAPAPCPFLSEPCAADFPKCV